MEPFSFEKMPEVLRQLFEKVERIEELLLAMSPAQQREDELLNVKEAADFLKVTVQSLYAKVNRMEIPVCKPGKRLYFSKSELIAWVEGSRRKTASELIAELKADKSRNKHRYF
ncbi:helix-turn-helix domain-containing protein [Pedobacter aquatilis]|uniref:helix-turn-helix domain-containing protein n=1 Tax=Pedobacter aquatilis TaxID=351343 RepID=UPI00292F8E0C|nr:helix-turn-helix domain-containing protein [Pedobacter aquatilis]